MASLTITGAGTEIDDVGAGSAQVVPVVNIQHLLIYLTAREEIISFASPDYSISEDAGPLPVTLLRQNSRGEKELAFTVAFTPGTATAGVNYTTSGAAFLFAIGVSSFDRAINILNAHSGVGVNKTFKVRIGVPPNREAYTMGPVSEALITINGVA